MHATVVITLAGIWLELGASLGTFIHVFKPGAPGQMPVHAWLLEYAFPKVYVCPPPCQYKTSGMMWHEIDSV